MLDSDNSYQYSLVPGKKRGDCPGEMRLYLSVVVFQSAGVLCGCRIYPTGYISSLLLGTGVPTVRGEKNAVVVWDPVGSGIIVQNAKRAAFTGCDSTAMHRFAERKGRTSGHMESCCGFCRDTGSFPAAVYETRRTSSFDGAVFTPVGACMVDNTTVCVRGILPDYTWGFSMRYDYGHDSFGFAKKAGDTGIKHFLYVRSHCASVLLLDFVYAFDADPLPCSVYASQCDGERPVAAINNSWYSR